MTATPTIVSLHVDSQVGKNNVYLAALVQHWVAASIAAWRVCRAASYYDKTMWTTVSSITY